jgi:hypothetical protein
MYQIAPFITELQEIFINTLNNYPANREIVLQLLDGRPATELRRLVPLKDLRESGAFFTGSQLGSIAISKTFASTINRTSVLVDPACGGGDLLLSCTPHLPIFPDLIETINHWKSNLVGIDLHSEFVEIAKFRLVLKAITLGAEITTLSYRLNSNIFNGFRVGSIFQNLDVLQNATHILLNPPFYMMPSPESCQWASGKVNAAAVFLETCVKNVQKGTRIAAILPDVLRSGTRYEKWRNFIESNCEIGRIHLYGQFDAWADVDVFVVELVVKNEPGIFSCDWVNLKKESGITLSDKFDISIGPVVEYRDPLTGPVVKFIHPHGLPAWSTVNVVENCRPYGGRTFQCPFVVVRRTSRQSDKFRAIGTIIDIDANVAVENHLIVMRPKDGNLSTCQDLLINLQDERTNAWINETIRCRHLTVKSLADMPWWSD